MHPSFSLFFKANALLTLILFSAFLVHFHDYTWINFLYALIATLSSATLLVIILYLLALPFSFLAPWGIRILGLLFVVANLSLIIDFFVYKLFHFHINAMVLNILTSPDAMDSIQAGLAPVIALFVALILFIYFEFMMYKKIQYITLNRQKQLNTKLNKILFLPLVLFIITDKVGFGFASLFSKNQMIAPVKVIPLYQPLTFTKVAAKYFGFKAEAQAKYSVNTHASLHYPLKALKVDNTKSTFPIYILALDSVNYTAITPELTPNISAFMDDALSLKYHFSGGNATRFGIFSLIYGLNATYWFNFLSANQKPVLFDVLKQRNYDISIFSSTNTNWPEFRKTCYVDIQDSIQDHFPGEPWQKDAENTQCFLEQLKNTPMDKPTFNFIFLDSPHGYSFPPEENHYQAEGGEINYLTITPESTELQTVHKRYKNALHYNDKLIGKMLAMLKAKGLYDKSLIIFTSDHGQEFFEYGNFGHNTSFSLAQTHVPMMVKLPKSLQHLTPPQGITSHEDIVPTLLSLLGVKNPTSEYSNGQNIFDSHFHRDYAFCANWNNNAIITSTTISVFSNLPNKIFHREVRDTQSYGKLQKVKTESKFILDTMNENKKFLK